MKKNFLFLILFLFQQLSAQITAETSPKEAAAIYQGALNPERVCFDVKFYDIQLELFPNRRSIKASVKMDFLITKETQYIQVDLDDALTIDSIMYEGAQLSFSKRLGKQAVLVYFPNPLTINSLHSITTHYQGTPTAALLPPWVGGFVWSPSIAVACEAKGASLWLACKDHPSDEPDSVAIHVTIPADNDKMAVCNGRLRGITPKGEKNTYNWFVSYPINLYNITFYVDNFVHIHDEMKGMEGKIDLDYYVLPEHQKKAQKHFQQVKDVIIIYESLFGPYPWIKDGYKLVESPFEGMEHQSAIAYGSGFGNRNQEADSYMDYILVHETAHEWWGNSITADDMAELWLHEGFATYSEALYLEIMYGKDIAKIHLFQDRLKIQGREPVIGPRDIHYDCTEATATYFNGDIYNKGTWILHALRNSIHHDSLFKNILYTFSTENRCSVLNTKKFIEHVNNKVKFLSNDSIDYDFSHFFEEYLYHKNVPRLKYYYQVEAGKTYFYYRWSNASENFSMPIHIQDKKHNITYSISPTKTFQKIAINKRLILSDLEDNYLITISESAN